MAEPEKTAEKGQRPWSHHPIWDILLIGFLLGYGALFDHLGLINFISGLFSYLDYGGLLAVIGIVYLLIPAIACALLLAMRMAFWSTYIKPIGRLWKLRALVVGGLIVYFVFPFTPLRSPGYKPFIAGLKIRVQRTLDVPAVQSWLATLRPDQCAGESIEIDYMDTHWPKDVNWPRELTGLKPNPHYVDLSMDDANHPMVRLTWGGGLGHWGLAIGHPDMKTPPSDMSEHGEYRVHVRDGTYVWYEL